MHWWHQWWFIISKILMHIFYCISCIKTFISKMYWKKTFGNGANFSRGPVSELIAIPISALKFLTTSRWYPLLSISSLTFTALTLFAWLVHTIFCIWRVLRDLSKDQPQPSMWASTNVAGTGSLGNQGTLYTDSTSHTNILYSCVLAHIDWLY